MPETVWKFATPLSKLDDVIHHEMPKGAKVLSVLNQRETLCIYALVDPDVRTTRRTFRVAGTGHPLGLEEYNGEGRPFLGSVSFQDGKLVFHVWELP